MLITDNPSPSVLGKLAPIRWIGARFDECHHWSPIHPGCLASVTSPLLATTLWRCTRCTKYTRCAQTCAETSAPKNGTESPAGCSRWAQRNRLPPPDPATARNCTQKMCCARLSKVWDISPFFYCPELNKDWTLLVSPLLFLPLLPSMDMCLICASYIYKYQSIFVKHWPIQSRYVQNYTHCLFTQTVQGLCKKTHFQSHCSVLKIYKNIFQQIGVHLSH